MLLHAHVRPTRMRCKVGLQRRRTLRGQPNYFTFQIHTVSSRRIYTDEAREEKWGDYPTAVLIEPLVGLVEGWDRDINNPQFSHSAMAAAGLDVNGGHGFDGD